MGTQTPSFIMLMQSTLNTPRDDINTSNANFSFSMAMIPMVSNLEKVHESLISKSVQNATNSVRILGGLIQNQLDNLLQNQLEKIQNQLEKSAWENRTKQIERTMVIPSESGCISLTSPTEVTNTTVEGTKKFPLRLRALIPPPQDNHLTLRLRALMPPPQSQAP